MQHYAALHNYRLVGGSDTVQYSTVTHLEGRQDVVLPRGADVPQDEVLVGRDCDGQLVPLDNVAQRLLRLTLDASVLQHTGEEKIQQ